MRINRFIARSGVTSRRKADELIMSGQITINGKVVTELGYEVRDNDRVGLNGRSVIIPDYYYYALNKPVGYTVTRNDPHAKKNIFELLPDEPSLFAVGRLDRDTSGLIVITNDGDFGQKLIHPTNKIEKEYRIGLKKPIKKNDLSRLLSGVTLSDGMTKAKKADLISDQVILLTIEMGRKRVIRRMIQAISNEVISLERTRIGNIKNDLKPGQYRKLSKSEKEDYV